MVKKRQYTRTAHIKKRLKTGKGPSLAFKKLFFHRLIVDVLTASLIDSIHVNLIILIK